MDDETPERRARFWHDEMHYGDPDPDCEHCPEVCILVRCSLPITDGTPSVTMPSGGAIHLECMYDWRRFGGPLRPAKKKED